MELETAHKQGLQIHDCFTQWICLIMNGLISNMDRNNTSNLTTSINQLSTSNGTILVQKRRILNTRNIKNHAKSCKVVMIDPNSWLNLRKKPVPLFANSGWRRHWLRKIDIAVALNTRNLFLRKWSKENIGKQSKAKAVHVQTWPQGTNQFKFKT